MKSHEEHLIQVSIAEFLDRAFVGQLATWFAVPNGEQRPTKEVRGRGGKKIKISPAGIRLKKEGVKAGVADIIVCYRGQLIALEVKTKTGRLSTHQKRFKNEIEVCGGKFFVVRSIEDAHEALSDCGVPMRVTPAMSKTPKVTVIPFAR